MPWVCSILPLVNNTYISQELNSRDSVFLRTDKDEKNTRELIRPLGWVVKLAVAPSEPRCITTAKVCCSINPLPASSHLALSWAVCSSLLFGGRPVNTRGQLSSLSSRFPSLPSTPAGVQASSRPPASWESGDPLVSSVCCHLSMPSVIGPRHSVTFSSLEEQRQQFLRKRHIKRPDVL